MIERRSVALVAGIGGALAFALLAGSVLARGGIALVDVPAARWAASTPAWLVAMARALDVLGSTPVVLGLTLSASLFLLVRRDAWAAAGVCVAALAGLGVTTFFKIAIARPRPEEMLVDVGGFAFPSGHTTSAVVVAVVALWVLARQRKRGAPLWAVGLGAAWALAMAAGRVVLGVHSATDVLGGIALGALVASATLAVVQRVEAR